MQTRSTCFTTLLGGAILAFMAPPAHAQSARYLRIALGSAQLEPPADEFRLSSARYPSVAIGWTSARGHGLELSISRFDTETTESPDPLSEAPYTIGIRATPLDLVYYYEPLLGSGRVRPRIGVGLAIIPVVDRWRSDTPTESASATLHSAGASLGLAVGLLGVASAVVRAGYQFADDGGDRRVRRVGLTGYRLEAGVELGF